VAKRVVKSAHERRRELLDAASAVFRARGAGEATVDEITAHAHVAKGTFYRYFATRDEIVIALRNEVGQRIIADVVARVPSPWTTADDWWSAVDAAIATFLDYLLDHADEHNALWHGSASTIGVPASDEVFPALVELVDQGAAAGFFVVDDTWLTVMMLFGAVHASADHALTRTDLDRPVVRAACLRLARRVLAP
jgi:AcrR family transcriptional regulator